MLENVRPIGYENVATMSLFDTFDGKRAPLST